MASSWQLRCMGILCCIWPVMGYNTDGPGCDGLVAILNIVCVSFFVLPVATVLMGHSTLGVHNINIDDVTGVATAFATICTDGLVGTSTNAADMCSTSHAWSQIVLTAQIIGYAWPGLWDAQKWWQAFLNPMEWADNGLLAVFVTCVSSIVEINIVSAIFNSAAGIRMGLAIVAALSVYMWPIILMIAWAIICLTVWVASVLVIYPIAGPLLTCLHVSFNVAVQAIGCAASLGNMPAAVTLHNAMFGLGWIILEGLRMLDAPSQRPAKQTRLLPWLSAIQLYCASMAAISALIAGHTQLAMWTLCLVILSLIKVIYALLPEQISIGLYLSYLHTDVILDCSVIALSHFSRGASPAFIELYLYMTATSTMGLLRFLVQWPGLMKEYWLGTDALAGLTKVEKSFLPWEDLKPGVQVFRTGAFGLGWLTHHGVFVGKMDFLHSKFNIPKTASCFLRLHEDMTLAGLLIEEWNRHHPEVQVAPSDKVAAVNGKLWRYQFKEEFTQSMILFITMKPAPVETGVRRMDYNITISKFDMLKLVGLGPSLDLTLVAWTVPRITSPDGWQLLEPVERVGRPRSMRSRSRSRPSGGSFPCEQEQEHPEMPCTGDLVLQVEEVNEAQLQLTLRRPVIVQGKHDRVIEMSGSPGNVSITGARWQDFRQALNASGSVTTAGGVVPQFRTTCFIRQHGSPSDSSTSDSSTSEDPAKALWAVKRALSSQYKKVAYGMHCNCETFALWCVLPRDDADTDVGFVGERSPQGEGLGSFGLACLAGICGALCWCFLSNWAYLAFEAVLVITLKLYHANRIATIPQRHTVTFRDLQLVPWRREEDKNEEGTTLLHS